MSMEGSSGIKTVPFPRRFQTFGLTLIDKDVQISVDRTETHFWMSSLDSFMNFLGRGVRGCPAQIVQYARPD